MSTTHGRSYAILFGAVAVLAAGLGIVLYTRLRRRAPHSDRDTVGFAASVRETARNPLQASATLAAGSDAGPAHKSGGNHRRRHVKTSHHPQ